MSIESVKESKRKYYVNNKEKISIYQKVYREANRKACSVHHKNGDRLDNRMENLELWHKGQPAGQRVEDKIEWCIEFLMFYGYKVIKE